MLPSGQPLLQNGMPQSMQRAPWSRSFLSVMSRAISLKPVGFPISIYKDFLPRRHEVTKRFLDFGSHFVSSCLRGSICFALHGSRLTFRELLRFRFDLRLMLKHSSII